MQILASALPGFRDLRAPLTAGYMWLILLWIVLKPHVATRPTNEIAGSVWDLGKAAGPIWVAIAVSVAAYLIGSISQLCSGPLNKFAGFISRNPRLSLGSWLSSPTTRSGTALFESIDRQRDRAWQKLGAPNGPTKDLSDRQAIEMVKTNEQIQRAASNLEMEIDLPATLLVGKEPELFTEVDRLKAESQLRFAIVPPLLAIIGYVSFADNWWWSLLAIPVFILWLQGHRREVEFKSLMISAFQQGLVRSQTLENLKEFVDNLPNIRNEGGGLRIRENS